MPPAESRVLLIDDDPTFIDISVRAFKEAGINYLTAFNGIEAIEKAKTENPSLILLDIMMPGIDGFAVLNKLKRDPRTSKIPVWMLTNLPGEMNKELAASLGAKGYLVKADNPPSVFCGKIKSFLGSAQSWESPK
jgi:CheY-like chemotaxis protein